jgi:dephospho-CoA kinase
MLVFGLTGSIGMGKTTAAGILQQQGLPVHDADAAVHAMLRRGGEAVPFVAAAFPETWDHRKREINRYKLGMIVFEDAGKRKELELILHPLVIKQQKRFMLSAQSVNTDAVVLDVPLLFETGVNKNCDYTICVTAPYFIQRQRVLSRPGMSEEKFIKRLESQYADIEKRRMADFVVQTGLGKGHTYKQLLNIVNRTIRPGKVACAR